MFMASALWAEVYAGRRGAAAGVPKHPINGSSPHGHKPGRARSPFKACQWTFAWGSNHCTP
jgi:hypothetical protein